MLVLKCKNCGLWDNYHYNLYTHKTCGNCGYLVIKEEKRKTKINKAQGGCKK